jgi:NAD(P)-dependent dehydrogenase (short-subunit alcohol dehydrogenase family)
MGTLANPLVEYAAAKAGLVRLTVTLGPPAAADGVRVNCVVPDWIATPATSAMLAAMTAEARAAAHVPDELTPPERIAGAVERFVRDDTLAGRVLVCWCDGPWALVAPGDRGYLRAEEVSPAWPDGAPSDRPAGAR